MSTVPICRSLISEQRCSQVIKVQQPACVVFGVWKTIPSVGALRPVNHEIIDASSIVEDASPTGLRVWES